MKKNFTTIFATAFFMLAFAAVSSAQSGNSSNTSDNQKNNSQTKVSKALKIKSKPASSSQGCSQESGRVRLRVTFDKSAKVTDVEIVKPSGCDIFDESSVKAAKKIKFEPQLNDGEAVTVSKLVEYNYHRY
jgi:TonB family protein